MYIYGLILTLAGVLQSFCQAQSDYALQRLGVRVRNRLMCALYRKCLKLSPKGLQARSVQTYFTHRPVSTFDRVGPFQLTGELFLYGTTLRRTGV